MIIGNKKLNNDVDKLVALVIENNLTYVTMEEREILEPILESLFINCSYNATRTKKALDNLIRNRLPSPMILDSFPGFHSRLAIKINGLFEYFIYYQQIFQYLKILFPNAKIYRNQWIGTKRIDFLIPEKKVGIILPQYQDSNSKLISKPIILGEYNLYKLRSNILTHGELKRILYW